MILKTLSEITDRKQRLKYLIENKAAAIKEKKAQVKFLNEGTPYTPKLVKPEGVQKSSDSGSATYEIVGNSIGFFDSHDDVSMSGSFNKTVQESGSSVYILADHKHSTGGIIAQNKGVFVKQMPIRELGFDAAGSTEVLSANIAPVYDEKIAMLYANGEIKQHSVGIRYVKIELAANDESDNELYANWTKYIGDVINREDAERNGYFWAVKEQQLLEISAVLWGSNPYTPTMGETDKQKIARLEEENKSLREKSRESTPEDEPIQFDIVSIYNKN